MVLKKTKRNSKVERCGFDSSTSVAKKNECRAKKTFNEQTSEIDRQSYSQASLHVDTGASQDSANKRPFDLELSDETFDAGSFRNPLPDDCTDMNPAEKIITGYTYVSANKLLSFSSIGAE